MLFLPLFFEEGLLIKKVPMENMGDLAVPQIQLKKVKSSDFVYFKGRGNGRGKR